jgi:hypothetical protein
VCFLLLDTKNANEKSIILSDITTYLLYYT